jgi:hypothetical protein
VLLIGAVGAMPGIGSLAVAVANAVEAVEDAAVMRGVDLGVVRQSVRDDPVALPRIQVMEDLVSPDATRRCGRVETLVVVGQDRPLAEKEIDVTAGLVLPGKTLRA